LPYPIETLDQQINVGQLADVVIALSTPHNSAVSEFGAERQAVRGQDTYTVEGITSGYFGDEEHQGTVYSFFEGLNTTSNNSTAFDETAETQGTVAYDIDPDIFNSGAPTGSVLSAVNGNAQVTLNWTAAPAAASYSVFRSLVSGGPYTMIASGLVSLTYLDTGLTNNTHYYYVIAAYQIGLGAFSNQAIAFPMAPPPPPFTPFEAEIMFDRATQMLTLSADLSQFPEQVIMDVDVNGTRTLTSLFAEMQNPRVLLVYADNGNVFTIDVGAGLGPQPTNLSFSDITGSSSLTLSLHTTELMTIHIFAAGD